MKRKNTIFGVVLSSLMLMTIPFATSNASAKTVGYGFHGDVNLDAEVNVADAVKLQKCLIKKETLENETSMLFSDMNDDSKVNVIDLALLKQTVTGNLDLSWVYHEVEDDTTEPATESTTEITTEATTEATTEITTTTTVPVTTTVTTTTVADFDDFITAPIKNIGASFTSQGNTKLVIFYVDFPDCKYSTEYTEAQLEEIAFGEEDKSDVSYPFESMSAFYKRSSKGAMNLTGKVFRYTAKENQSSYDNDKVKLAEECFAAFDSEYDFSTFDSNNDGKIDATLFTVPTAAGDTNWWPCAGAFGDDSYSVDGVKVGHIITGNADPSDSSNYPTGTINFNSSYLHELGHCAGLPDYYQYSGDDIWGFHGTAGNELMDDATSDFSAFSKLMLGWYKKSQINVYDSTLGTQTYELKNSETDDGNCVIIPCGTLDSNYFSEYMIIEYNTADGNNSSVSNWKETTDGIRIHHIRADYANNGWWSYFKYENGGEANPSGSDGIRLIRLVNDGNAPFQTGDVINSSTSGFGWYDSNGKETVDTGVEVTIGNKTSDGYTITISNK